MTAILDIQDATVEYSTRGSLVRALDGATLRVEPGETLGIVGESGSGKSTLGLLCGRLLPANAAVTATRARVDGNELLELDNDGIRRLRRDCLGFIPQDPVAALDPTMRTRLQERFHKPNERLAKITGLKLDDWWRRPRASVPQAGESLESRPVQALVASGATATRATSK